MTLSTTVKSTVRRWPPDLTTPPPDPRDQLKLRHRRNKEPILTFIKPNRFERHNRKKAKPAPPKVKPAKAKLPNGKYFGKVIWERLKEYKPDKRKLRGARKKEAARLYKLKYPKGKPMASKPAQPHRAYITSKDIENLMHLDPRPARRYLTRVRKKLGKPAREIITLKEFCEATPFTKEEVIPFLKK